MVYEEHSSTFTGVSAEARMLHTAASAIEVGVGLTRGAVELATGAVKGSIELTGEAARALPRLARLGQIQPHTRISLAGILAEQAKASPKGFASSSKTAPTPTKPSRTASTTLCAA